MAIGLEDGARLPERVIQTGLFAAGGAVIGTVFNHPIATAFFTAMAAGLGYQLANDLYVYTRESCCPRRQVNIRREETADRET